jgi:hypothetical protein
LRQKSYDVWDILLDPDDRQVTKPLNDWHNKIVGRTAGHKRGRIKWALDR